MTKLIKNPVTLCVAFAVLAFIQEWRGRGRKINIGYIGHMTKCDLVLRVFFGDNIQAFNSQLGDFTFLPDGTTIRKGRICNFCTIVLCQHPASVLISTQPAFSSPEPRNQITFADRACSSRLRPIVISNSVWLGARVMFMDGVTIGYGSIIAPDAVMTRDQALLIMAGWLPASRLVNALHWIRRP